MLRKLDRNARVVFVTPPLSNLTDRDGFVSPSRPKFPNMPELMLAGALRAARPDVRVEIKNLRILEPDRLEGYKRIGYHGRELEAVRVGAPFHEAKEEMEAADVICISNNFTQNAEVTRDFIRYAHEVNPRTVIIVGGSDVAARYSYYTQAGTDIAVLAEGEKRLPAILDCLTGSANGNLIKIPQIAVKMGNSDTEVRVTGRTMAGPYLRLGSYKREAVDKYTTDMNTVPFPALDLVDIQKFDESGEGLLIPGVSPPIMHFESSRGCHECCTFCATPNLKGDAYRYMHTARIKELLEYYQRMGIQSLALNEDNLLTRVALNPKQGIREIVEMFSLMRQMRFAWEFDGGIQVGLLYDTQARAIRRELFDAMFYNNAGVDGKWVGCYRIYVPLERLDEKDMHRFRKLQPFEVELELIRAMACAGIPAIYLGIIVGVPTDTDETVRITRERCQEIQRAVRAMNDSKTGHVAHSYTWFSFFNEILIPGSVDWVRFQKQLAYPVEEYPELWNFHTSVLKKQDGLSPLHFHEMRYALSAEFNGADALERFRRIGRYQPSDGRLLLHGGKTP